MRSNDKPEFFSKDIFKQDNEENESTECPDLLMQNKEWIDKICNSLKDIRNYSPQKVFDLINNYENSKEKLPRILYSQITANIFTVDDQIRGVILQNIESLVYYALKDVEDKSSQNENSYSNTVKTVIRIYDHVNLASQQVSETIKSTKETTENLEKRVKLVNEKLDNSQREYVAILGIFATVVVTFMGGMMFTSSTLTGMAQVSIYRLIGMIALLGFVLFNLSLLLIRFLLLITGNIQREQVGKDVFSLNLLQWNKFSFIEKMNTVFVFLFIGTFIMWLLNCRGMGTLFLQIFGRKL